MDYIDLIDKFDPEEWIPYEELLKTNEWAAVRKRIVERDKSRCTLCFRTYSTRYLSFNLAFSPNSQLVEGSIKYIETPIDQFKKEFDIDKIVILKFPHLENVFCGVTNKGQLLIVDWENIKSNPVDLVINSGETESGDIYFVISRRSDLVLNYTYSIPILTESPFTSK